jgi:hypothetical protein
MDHCLKVSMGSSSSTISFSSLQCHSSTTYMYEKQRYSRPRIPSRTWEAYILLHRYLVLLILLLVLFLFCCILILLRTYYSGADFYVDFIGYCLQVFRSLHVCSIDLTVYHTYRYDYGLSLYQISHVWPQWFISYCLMLFYNYTEKISYETLFSNYYMFRSYDHLKAGIYTYIHIYMR